TMMSSRVITGGSQVFSLFISTAHTDIYTLSLHDALPISGHRGPAARGRRVDPRAPCRDDPSAGFVAVRERPGHHDRVLAGHAFQAGRMERHAHQARDAARPRIGAARGDAGDVVGLT